MQNAASKSWPRGPRCNCYMFGYQRRIRSLKCLRKGNGGNGENFETRGHFVHFPTNVLSLCPRDNVRGLQWRSHSPFSLPFHHFDLGMRHQCECYRRIGCHSITISKCSTANAIFQGFSTFPGTSCGIRSFFLRNRTTVLLKLPLFVLK